HNIGAGGRDHGTGGRRARLCRVGGRHDPHTRAHDGEGAEEVLDEDDLADGSSPDAGSLVQTGSFTIDSQDGLSTLTIGGVSVFDASSTTTFPVTIDDPVYGLLEITGIATTTDANGDVVSATVSYSYTLDDNSLLHTGGNDGSFTDSFDVVATDTDGSSDTASLDITVIDDTPTANDDTAGQVNENAPVTVDVFGNDTAGADGVAFDAIALVDGTLSGAGQLVNNGDGTFTYTPGPGEEGTVTFDYEITDGDGDVSTATVTIDLLEDSEPEIGVEGENIVAEAGLGARPGEPEGSDAASDSEFTSGVIAVSTGNDTVGSLVINGVDVTNGGTVTTANGVLTVALENGDYTYTYELSDNTLADPDSDS
ncbi:MAG: Ig-like domain-containing protein, partial [Marinobacter alexandrii]|uniref:Ig-like domain-containing protein n=1 Tax=Marinobacter alexandrii TaxID=2570351 RepID=UPI003297AA4D